MKTFLGHIPTSLIALVFIISTSCGTSNPDPVELDLDLISSTTVNGYTVNLLSYNSLEQGANELYWQIEKDHSPVDISSFVIVPMMTSETIQQSTPYSNPIEFKENKAYHFCSVVFTTPTNESNSWVIDFEITTKNNETISSSFSVEVAPSWRVKSIQAKDKDIYFIIWDKPKTPVLGVHYLDLLVHKKESSLSYPMVSNGNIEIYPYRNLGSGNIHNTNFADPVSRGMGRYKGYINYDVTGQWITSVKLTAADDTLSSVYFTYRVNSQ